MNQDRKNIIEAIVGGIVAGAALAAGAELWSLVSPVKRRAVREEKLHALMASQPEEEGYE